MKKIIVLLTVFCVAVCTFSGCSCSSKKEDSSDIITIKGADGKEYESYREACRAGDYDVAHKFVDKMKEEGKVYYEINEAEDYIFNYEVNTLISQNSKEANDRVVYLLNEFTIIGERGPIGIDHHDDTPYGKSCARFNKKCNKILDISISLKNQDMAKKIIPLYKEDEILGSNGNYYIKAYTYDTKEAAQKKYDEAVKNGAFD